MENSKNHPSTSPNVSPPSSAPFYQCPQEPVLSKQQDVEDQDGEEDHGEQELCQMSSPSPGTPPPPREKQEQLSSSMECVSSIALSSPSSQLIREGGESQEKEKKGQEEEQLPPTETSSSTSPSPPYQEHHHLQGEQKLPSIQTSAASRPHPSAPTVPGTSIPIAQQSRLTTLALEVLSQDPFQGPRLLDVIFRACISIALTAAGRPGSWLGPGATWMNVPARPSQVPDPSRAPRESANKAAGVGQPTVGDGSGSGAEQVQGVVVNASGLTLLRRISALEAMVFMMRPELRRYPEDLKKAAEESEDNPHKDLELRMITLEESVELLAHNWIRRERGMRKNMEAAIQRVEGVRDEMERRIGEEVKKVEELGQETMTMTDEARLNATELYSMLADRVAKMEQEMIERKEEKALKILTELHELNKQMKEELLYGSEDGGVDGSAEAEEAMGKATEKREGEADSSRAAEERMGKTTKKSERECKGKGKGKAKGKGKK